MGGHGVRGFARDLFRSLKKPCKTGNPLSIAYSGNVVDLLEYIAANRIHVDLLSDQTSCHVAYEGGYCPQGITFEERTRLLATDRDRFRNLVAPSAPAL